MFSRCLLTGRRKNLGEAEAEVLDLARDQVLDLKIVLAAILALVDGTCVDLTVSLPMPVISIGTLQDALKSMPRLALDVEVVEASSVDLRNSQGATLLVAPVRQTRRSRPNDGVDVIPEVGSVNEIRGITVVRCDTRRAAIISLAARIKRERPGALLVSIKANKAQERYHRNTGADEHCLAPP